MAIYAIADLHLSFKVDKPMKVFGDNWFNYEDKIRDDWNKRVAKSDVVLIPGDISWGMTLEEADEDLLWINNLPGKKILLRGNHDYWWKSVTKLNELYENMFFLQNTYYPYKGIAICGTRGWLCPNSKKFSDQDEKIYIRELKRLELSLEKAKKDGYDKIIVMLHYPPTNDEKEESGFIELINNYSVNNVIYGHIHGKESYDASLRGVYNSISYNLVSADYLDFKLLKIL